ncbi:unnamed protein product [Orchesella dallaii]|uniref:Uncharacterized protein n=1 Tax=Orchesella dallaii TaxID=48710 RepID=A0ABP1RYR0_9HEXA
MKRKLEVRKYINPEFSGICSKETKASEWLFGSDLNETLKESKTTASVMRATLTRGHRPAPYPSVGSFRRAQSSLNFHRSPHPTPRRGQWSTFRGRTQFRNSRYPSSNLQPQFQATQRKFQ